MKTKTISTANFPIVVSSQHVIYVFTRILQQGKLEFSNIGRENQAPVGFCLFLNGNFRGGKEQTDFRVTRNRKRSPRTRQLKFTLYLPCAFLLFFLLSLTHACSQQFLNLDTKSFWVFMFSVSFSAPSPPANYENFFIIFFLFLSF